MMKTINNIHPLFPDQASIAAAVSSLSEPDKASYLSLLEAYNTEINSTLINHEKVAELIREAQELLKNC